ncbi:MAG: putative toxin-antitoxin system toxin component, PIN family [Bacteroidales bacterium]|nr:putative toxin-antitoxin system toxin component, PIN family [Bacteroidales bacterium]
MKIVVDTNIVFSALISSSFTIPEIIIAPYNDFKFYTSEYLFEELERHRHKLQKNSKLTEKEIEKAKTALFKYINTISLEIIPQQIWQEAEFLTFDIDLDDTPFVALSIFLNAYLWTGDKALYNGLINKGFNKVLLTSDLKQITAGFE